MLRSRRIFAYVHPVRCYSTAKAAPKRSPVKKVSSRERIELASKSFSDIFEGYFTNEESFEPIDTKPIYQNPRKFLELSQFHRQQVIEEVGKLMKRNWKNIPKDTKATAYFISYGNWGAREDLSDNLNSTHVPEDLPFQFPSKLATLEPNSKDVVHKLPEVDLLQCSKARRDYWKKVTRTLDPFTRFIVYVGGLIALGALYRDKYIGDTGDIQITESPLVTADEKQLLQEKIKEENEIMKFESQQNKRKWYYLWLK